MASRTADDLLSPEGAVLADPADVEHALVKMWAPAGEQAVGHAAKTATRVSVANLVVFAPATQWNQLLEFMAELSPLMPTRTIVLLVAEGPEAPAEITASVSALCHVPQDGEAQVCCEQIVLRAGPAHVDVLDETLLPLLESDVPVMCWWRYDAAAWPHLFAAMQTIARRMILDSGRIQNCVASSADCAVRDLGWYQSARLRELVAQMFDGCCSGVARSIHRVEIDAGATPVGEIDGLWLSAFLAGQLGWLPVMAEPLGEVGDAHRCMVFQFQFGEQTIGVRLVRRPDGGDRLSRVDIAAGDETFHLERRGDAANEYRLTVCSRGVCAAPRSVQVPAVRISEALAAGLAGRPVDAAFERAWPIAAWMARPCAAGGQWK